MRGLRTIVLLLALGLTGCPGVSAGSTPESTVAAFSSALREGRIEDAYGLMSESYRRRVSLSEFRRYFRDYPSEVQQTARALAQRRGRAQQEAVVEYGEAESLRLVREHGDWRVATDVVDF
jgi:hypothetical protein